MRYLIDHQTRVGFPAAVREHLCELRLEPVTDRHQRLLTAHIDAEPEADIQRYRDAFGNEVHHFSITAPHDHLTTRLVAEVECLRDNPFDFPALAPRREGDWIAHALRDVPRLWDYVLHRSPMTPAATTVELAGSPDHDDADIPLVQAVQDVMAWIGDEFRYDPEATEVHSPLAAMLERRAGVCQDFAHLLITIVRGWDVPARYVMGYHYPGEDEPAAAPATHAWVEVLVPGADWLGFDPTHGLLADDHYIKVAVGRDVRDATPQRGSFKGDEDGEAPDVMISITPQ
ncbi:MAG: transglutaminase family protein [Gammaproteobacteria bacterium]|nr:transglutaminase family protein [Gammaproteobacteria bacterium]